MKKCEYCVVYDKHQCELGYCNQAINRMMEMEKFRIEQEARFAANTSTKNINITKRKDK